MVVQCVGLSLLLLSCLVSLASPAPVSPLTSQEDGDEAMSKALNLVQPSQLEAHSIEIPLFEDLPPLEGDAHDEAAPMSYVDASVFRRPADAVKPKTSSFTKKPITNMNKHSKEEHEMKNDKTMAPSENLEPPIDDKLFDVEVNNKVAAILSVIREIVNLGNKNFESISSTGNNDEESTTPTTTSDRTTSSQSPETTNENSELPRLSPTTTTTTTTEASSSSPPPARSNVDSELPRLSPPIWLHSSLAEAMSDPLRLPMVEPYDRYDRYSHSIARDVLW